MKRDINIVVGGEAGQGVQSVGLILSKALVRGGYHVFADQDYESRVRGGHNFFRVRAGKTEVNAISDSVDILLALNEETVKLHSQKVAENGVIIFDENTVGSPANNSNAIGIPLEKLAEEEGGSKVMANTVGLGAVLGVMTYDFGILEQVLSEHFGKGESGTGNIKAAGAGYNRVQKENRKGLNLSPVKTVRSRMLLTGNEAIALGAIAAGCRFMSAYPMTPASSIMEYLAAHGDDFGIVVVQAEDEIAAINMITGAGYAGARAMTATSGGGFSLMVEGLGLAGITETPIVVVNAQRPGPAIGLPTRTEQGDMEFMLYASHGEFPRAVLAPATVEECFYLTVKAFNLADKYQLPVMILTDQHLASSYATVDKFDLDGVNIDRGLLLSGDEPGSEYKRHRITKSGISPRAFPGRKDLLVVTDSDEHDESGHLIEDAETRIKMMQKRMRKLTGLRGDISPPRIKGKKNAGILLIGWGSTAGAIEEAAEILRKEGLNIGSLHFSELLPFPAEAAIKALDKAGASYVIENNATGQLAHLIRAETGRQVTRKILKYDGRPFSPAYIAAEVKKETR